MIISNVGIDLAKNVFVVTMLPEWKNCSGKTLSIKCCIF